MKHFVHEGQPSRVVFGVGRRVELAVEIDRLGASRVLILTGPRHAAIASEFAAQLGRRFVEVHPHAAMHVPSDTAEKAIQLARDVDADVCVAVGGGSAIGLAKAVARVTGLPVVAVPTTYAGSEMTPIWGLTESSRKTTGRDPRVLPRTVIYDPQLTTTLTPEASATSGINALAHSAEALYSPDVSPVTTMIATESVAALAGALPQVTADPLDLDARSTTLYGAWLAGTCLGATAMSLHHKLCHILGGAFNLPHAQTHTTVLPHVLAYNLPAAPSAAHALAVALGGDPVDRLVMLIDKLGVGRSLAELGMPEDGIEKAVISATANSDSYANPRPVSAEAVRAIIRGAFEGSAPHT
ncbi:maleylacetate reductase [Mycolicibacterium stellerae]|uniref:maleylacetate reductase n=1 Tax=Mycolicibacterium stellerae TaxID=2358193 RepID=UPI000F0B8312|nr:maleylacetate reductase [Mycolicibacterium stellerae]